MILPAAEIDRHATVGPVSLVMRGERVPPGTRWSGNPIGPWADDDAPPGGTADEHDDEDDAREREHMEERA